MPKFEIGQRYYTPNGRTIEVAGVQQIEVGGLDEDNEIEFVVVAFRFVGMHHIHIRKAEDMAEWPAIPMEV